MNNNNCISGNQLVIIAGILSIIIAQRLNIFQLSLASSFFSALGDNLGIIETYIENIKEQQEELNERNNDKDDDGNSASAEDIEELQSQINQLKLYIRKLENKMDC
jgi:peptidoglycan hydrolase CwlO-like protein